MKSLAVVLPGAALPFAGCATPRADFTPARNAWLGASSEEVVMKWRTPVRSTSFNHGRLIYTWFSEGVAPRDAMRPTIAISAGNSSNVGIGVTSGLDRDATVACERTLIFRDEPVVDQSWFGPADFLSAFRRN